MSGTKIAICDDDARFSAYLQSLLQAYSTQRIHQSISVSAFEKGADLLEAARRLEGFDIYLLDILLPDGDGISLGRRLREAGYNGKIIYMTVSADYAIDAYSVQAFNYLVKPLDGDALFPVLDQAIDSLSVQLEKGLIVKTSGSSVRISFDSIVYAELKQRSIIYHLTYGRTVESRQIRTPFSEAVQELLLDDRFVRCGASVVANMHQIVLVGKDCLFFRDGSCVYIPHKVCASVRSLWTHFWFDGGAQS